MQVHKVFILIFFLLFQPALYPLVAQVAPVIEEIDKTSGTVNEVVTIKGKGFGSVANQVRVFFGAALADSIIRIEDSEIQVAVPAGATSSSISVTNTNTHLTAYSNQLFTLSYSGIDFDKNNLESERKFTTSGTNLYNLCFCDFNLDGLNDIATTDTDSKLVTILQNNTPDINSQASFISQEINLDAKTRWVRCGDMNGDGFPDLVFSASNTNINKERIYVFKNTSTRGGNITFEDKDAKSPVSSYSVEGTLAARMEIKDLDGDGLPEIVAVDLSVIGGVSVFRNISTPGEAINFTPTPIKPFSTFGIPTVELNSVDLEDLNGDGLPELLAGKEGKNGTYIFTNNSTPGNIQFSSYMMLDAPGRTSNMKVGDVDNDRKPDVVITNEAYVGVFKNITEAGGPITFANHVRFDQTLLAREGLDMADMDGNGKLDLIIGSTTNWVVVLLNNSTAGGLDFNTKKVLLVGENNMSARAGDLNGDGKPDLAYTARDTDVIAVLLNRNCVKPVLEPQSGLNVCDVLPYQLTITQAIGVTYTWESSADRINFTAVADAADSTISYTTSNEAFYRVKMSSSHNGFTCTDIVSNIVKVVRPDGFVPDKPVILDRNPVTPYCFGESIFLQAASVNAEYHWTGPNHFESNEQNPVIPNATVAHEGTYILYVQANAENGGCVSDTATTYIKVTEPEAITIHSNDFPVFFEGGQATLSIEASPLNEYSWKRNGQVISNATTAELTATTEGNYVAVIKNVSGCTRESDAFSIAFAHANIPEEKCLGEIIEYTVTPASLAGQNIQYRWYFGDGTTATESVVTHQYESEGIYTVAIEILDADGSVVDRHEEDIAILDLPEISITSTNNAYLCPGERIELAVNDGFSSYTWNTGETSKNITVNAAGTYTVTVVAHSGCIISQDIEVKGTDNPGNEITARTNHIPLGDTLQLVAPPDAAAYLWSPSDGLSDNTIARPMARPLKTTTYTCLITNAQGCQSTAEFTVTVDRPLDIKAQKVFTPNDDGKHDTWFIEKMDLYPDCRMTIFNRQGIKIYETESYSNENGWDGTIRGRPTPAGVYFYLIDCGKEAGSQTGSVTIVR